MTLLCKNCKYHEPFWGYYNYSGTLDACNHPELKRTLNPVTGQSFKTMCYLMRMKGEKCGPNAEYWEEKEPPKPKKGFWANLFGK